MPTAPRSIVIFDGYCNFCSAIAKWIIRHDRHDRFRLAAAQSAGGAKVLGELKISNSQAESVILVEGGKIHTSSSAALRIARRLGRINALLYAFIIVPPFIRNAFYKVIASNRYKWFGKRDSCFVPDASQLNKFL